MLIWARNIHTRNVTFEAGVLASAPVRNSYVAYLVFDGLIKVLVLTLPASQKYLAYRMLDVFFRFFGMFLRGAFVSKGDTSYLVYQKE